MPSLQDGDSLGSLNKFREGDDPSENASLKNTDKFADVESDLTFVGICGIKVRRVDERAGAFFFVRGVPRPTVVCAGGNGMAYG